VLLWDQEGTIGLEELTTGNAGVFRVIQVSTQHISYTEAMRDSQTKTTFHCWALLLLAVFTSIPSQAADDWSALQPGRIVLFRHANAPGVGDPTGFKLNDCRTQRNLDAVGRAQARRIGMAFRRWRVVVGAVLTSQWCRTRETASLAFPGQVQDEPAFNSFFEDRNLEPQQTAAALGVLSAWVGPGVLVVVTHQVNIAALTGVSPASGEGVVVRVVGGKLEVLGRIVP
jgi:phosphohistidine phosphatase SixA